MSKHLPIIFVIIGITAIGALFIFIAQPAPASEQRRTTEERGLSALAAPETSFDFGNISMANGPVTHIFKISNTADAPVTIEKIYTSCMCTSARLISPNGSFGPFGMPGHGSIPSINTELAPNAEADVEVVFDPAAHGPAGVGGITRNVYIENSPDQALTFTFNAYVTP